MMIEIYYTFTCLTSFFLSFFGTATKFFFLQERVLFFFQFMFLHTRSLTILAFWL